MTEPASIRYKNPGAMWGGNAISRKWGELGNVALNDGTGQGNHIAVFPTYVAGICAQLDLWRSSAHYRNKRFADAIATWSGHNSVPSYIKLVTRRVPGMTGDTVMNDEFWRGPMCIPFLKAQAFHEAGKEYPAPDADWIEARRRVLGGVAPTAQPAPKPAPVTKPSRKPLLPQPAPMPAAHSTSIAASILTALAAIFTFAQTRPEIALGVVAAAIVIIVLIVRHHFKKG